jgi:hypothetical protein
MFPLDRDLLLLIKFFVVLTCVFFWVRLIYLGIKRHHDIHGHRMDD